MTFLVSWGYYTTIMNICLCFLKAIVNMTKDIHDIRVENLKSFIAKTFNGSINAFAKSIDKNASQFYNLFKKERTFGENLARDLERKLELGLGYFDQPGGGDNDLSYIPEYSIKLSAGKGCEVIDENIIRQIPLLKSELKSMGLHESNLVIFTIDGESMMASLFSGERVLIDTSNKQPIDNRIFARITPF